MKKRILSFLLAAMMLVGTVLATGTSAEEAFYPDAADHWAREHIEYVSDKGMMNGIGDGLFGPDDAVSRAMVVTVLYRLAGEPDVTFFSRFSDVAKGEWYSNAVIWGAAKGIVKGYDDGTFGPDNDVSRQELVTFLGRFAPLYFIKLDGADLGAFKDAGTVESWALDYFKWAFKTGLVNGVEEDVLGPLEGATRAQFATIMHRFDTSEKLEYELVYNEPVPMSTYTEPEYPLQDDADLFVSPDGDDENPGTKEKPLATMEGAMAAVRELKKTKTGDIKVAFMAGTYKNTNAVFTSEDSGNGGTVTYCAYGDGEVKFNNGLEISAEEFEELDEDEKKYFQAKRVPNIKKYDLTGILAPEDVMAAALYNDGKTLVTARYPDRNMVTGFDSHMPYACEYVSNNQIRLATGNVINKFKGYHTFENVYIYGYLLWDFYCETSKIVDYDKETNVVTLTNLNGVSLDEDQGGYWPQKPFIVVNVSEELTSKGEYYIDHNTMTLYVYDPVGSYELAYNKEEMIRVEDASDITFQGLDFSCTAGNEFLYNTEFPYAVRFESDGIVGELIREESAFYTDTAAKNITIEGCTFSKMSNVYAVFLDGYNVRFTGNEIYEVAGGGIYSDCGSQENYDTLTSMKKVIDNNSIHNNGIKYQTFKQGIYSHDVGAIISHNELYDLSHYAIEPVGVETIIEYNHIHDCNQIGDGGAIYSGKSHTHVGNEIRYNIFANNPGGFHIYLDDGLAGMKIYGNVFFNNEETGTTSIRLAGGREVQIYDNVFIMNNRLPTAIHIWAKFYDMAYFGDLDQSANWQAWAMGNEWPTAGNDSAWREKYPWLFEIDYDTVNWRETYTNPNHYSAPNNDVIKNNYTFVLGNELDEAQQYDYSDETGIIAKLGDVQNNCVIDNEKNPLFVDPTHGDYTLREDADESVISVIPEIPFELIGRY